MYVVCLYIRVSVGTNILRCMFLQPYVLHGMSLIHAWVGIAATKFAYEVLPLEHVFPTDGPPVCIMQPAVTLVNYVCTTKITQ
jgi:hypothetical protein